ncbi:putative arylamine N-acetyltransferase 2 [Fusarium oxysporum f. sp. albedinis]|nr:putative arylamine N-acetyltransferase 2 [Fusarium oxysporum f. sp. albedinis]
MIERFLKTTAGKVKEEGRGGKGIGRKLYSSMGLQESMSRLRGPILQHIDSLLVHAVAHRGMLDCPHKLLSTRRRARLIISVGLQGNQYQAYIRY